MTLDVVKSFSILSWKFILSYTFDIRVAIQTDVKIFAFRHSHVNVYSLFLINECKGAPKVSLSLGFQIAWDSGA